MIRQSVKGVRLTANKFVLIYILFYNDLHKASLNFFFTRFSLRFVGAAATSQVTTSLGLPTHTAFRLDEASNSYNQDLR